MKTGKKYRFFNHSKDVQCIAFSPNGEIIAGGDESEVIKFWSVKTGKLIKIFGGHSKKRFGLRYGVNSVSFSPDGTVLVASYSHDGLGQLWSVEKGNRIRAFQNTWHLFFSADGNYMVDCTNRIRLWSSPTGEKEESLSQAKTYFFQGLDFFKEGKIIEADRIWKESMKTSLPKTLFYYLANAGRIACEFKRKHQAEDYKGIENTRKEFTRLWEKMLAKYPNYLQILQKIRPIRSIYFKDKIDEMSKK